MKSSRLTSALAGPVLFGTAALGALAAVLVVSLTTRTPTTLPPITPAELVDSMHQATSGPMSGTVRMVERLGLTTMGAQRDSSSGLRIARLWSDGHGRRRISLPTDGGEHTIVDDGARVWSWDSATRTVTCGPNHTPSSISARSLTRFGARELLSNPVNAAGELLTMLASSSVPRMDPVSVVAGRTAYELVLDPLPTERTMLREVKIAVDGQTRMPLEVTVLANGSSDPVVRIGFRDITFGPQKPALFTFTPPRGSTVLPRRGDCTTTSGAKQPNTGLIGQGWDTVLIRHVQPDSSVGSQASPLLSIPISGQWGRGRLLRTAIGDAVITADGRMALGAVPAQVLTEALSQ